MSIAKKRRKAELVWYFTHFCPINFRLILTPLGITTRTFEFPDYGCSKFIKYKDVFVFGVRIMRLQVSL